MNVCIQIWCILSMPHFGLGKEWGIINPVIANLVKAQLLKCFGGNIEIQGHKLCFVGNGF